MSLGSVYTVETLPAYCPVAESETATTYVSLAAVSRLSWSRG